MPGGFNALRGGQNAPELLHLTGGRRPGPASGGPRRIYPLVEKPVDPVDTAETPCNQAYTPISRNFRRRLRRRSSGGSEPSSSSAPTSASRSRRAASSGLSWAPAAGSGTIASITPSSRQSPASSRKAAAAFFASAMSRQRIAAQPSGEITA